MSSKLNIDNFRKLIAALRGGLYQQGKNTMKTPDGKFCCLGVAHECLIGPLVNTPEQDVSGLGLSLSARLSQMTQPEYNAVCEALGVSRDLRYKLSSMNNSLSNPRSFSEIAAFLEGYLEAKTLYAEEP